MSRIREEKDWKKKKKNKRKRKKTGCDQRRKFSTIKKTKANRNPFLRTNPFFHLKMPIIIVKCVTLFAHILHCNFYFHKYRIISNIFWHRLGIDLHIFFQWKIDEIHSIHMLMTNERKTHHMIFGTLSDGQINIITCTPFKYDKYRTICSWTKL